MTADDTRRYAAMTARSSAYAALTQAQVEQVLAEASRVFSEYTGTADPGAEADTAVQDIAAVRLNMMGAEGTSSASEGDLSRTWTDLPDALRSRLNRWRVPVGL